MFRRSVVSQQVRDLGVKFCDGCGISTRVERSARRLEAARTSAVLGLPHEPPDHIHRATSTLQGAQT